MRLSRGLTKKEAIALMKQRIMESEASYSSQQHMLRLLEELE
jgi:hypothetical protein